MSWLLDLLVDAIKETVSLFIIDMMGLITDVFTDLLSCNLSLFEELFSVVGSLYQNVIVPMGIALLLMIFIWQLFKSMFGKLGVNAEEPIELIGRSSICLFFVVASKSVVNYILRIAGTPYQWVMGTDIKVQSFSEYVSALEGITAPLGLGTVSIAILMLIMQFVVAWNYFKMLFVIAERYVLLGVFSYTAPLAFATGGSKFTNNILAAWAKMFGGQVVLIILNAWCLKMFLSGYGNMMASGYGFTKFFVATLCLVGFCKITFKLDSYMAALGVNLGRPSPGMGAFGAAMAAQRIFSQAGRVFSGADGSGNGTGTSTNMGNMSGTANGFDGPTGPIPMNPSGGNEVDVESLFSSGDFDTEYPEKRADAAGSAKSVNLSNSASGNVLDELEMGKHAAVTDSCSISYVSGAGKNVVTPSSEVEPGMEAEAYGSADQEGSAMDLNAGSLPEYQDASETGTVFSNGVMANETVENGFSEALSSESGFGEMDALGEANLMDSQTTTGDDSLSSKSQSFEGASAFSNDNGIMAELGDYPDPGTDVGAFAYGSGTEFGSNTENASQELGSDRDTSLDGSGNHTDLGGNIETSADSRNNGYSDMSKNSLDGMEPLYGVHSNMGILDAVAGSDSNFSNPSMEVSGVDRFSEENGTASDSVSGGAEIENSTFSDSGIPESMGNSLGMANGGDHFGNAVKPGNAEGYFGAGNSGMESLSGIGDPESDGAAEPDGYMEQESLEPIEMANDGLELPEEMNEMDEIQTEPSEIPMNMELLHNPHRIREVPKSRSELLKYRQIGNDTGGREDETHG